MQTEKVKEAMDKHQREQRTERAALDLVRRNSLHNPKDSMTITLDGMDQKKASLPHVLRWAKGLLETAAVAVHILGVMVWPAVKVGGSDASDALTTRFVVAFKSILLVSCRKIRRDKAPTSSPTCGTCHTTPTTL